MSSIMRWRRGVMGSSFAMWTTHWRVISMLSQLEQTADSGPELSTDDGCRSSGSYGWSRTTPAKRVSPRDVIMRAPHPDFRGELQRRCWSSNTADQEIGPLWGQFPTTGYACYYQCRSNTGHSACHPLAIF